MKIHFVLLCLLISSILANATVQNSASQDKPPRLYVKSYNINNNDSAADTSTNLFCASCNETPPAIYPDIITNVGTETWINQENMNWQDGNSGTYSESSYDYGNALLTTLTTINQSWPESFWPNISAYEIDTSTWINSTVTGPIPPYTYSSSTNINPNSNPQIFEEHCDVSYAAITVDTPGVNITGATTTKNRRNADTQMKLQSGGKAIPKLKSLVYITASATQNNPINYAWDLLPENEWQGDYSTNIPSQEIAIGGYGNLSLNGVIYVALSGNDDVVVTPTVQGVNYYNFNISESPVQTKADWQQVVRNEIYADTGGNADMNIYNPANGFMANRTNLQAVYAFYQKLFTENGNLYWAGLGKLAGAPVYAGLSDAQQVTISLFGIGTGNLTAFQNQLITMNADILQDLAWQSEAYYKGGINALEEVYAVEPSALDLNTINAWQEIDQGIQQNNASMVQAGNLQLAHREQLTVLQSDYDILNGMNGISTYMSVLAQNPVPGASAFSTVVPGGNLCVFNDRWNWITNNSGGIWPSWVATPQTTQSAWVNILLTTRAANYALFPPIIQ
jgi:hypothetical protein